MTSDAARLAAVTPDAVPTLDPATVRWGDDGLIAAVAQDARDGRVLMVAWQDREALDATLASGEVHFHSRSRGRLWRKGETSGNVLRLVSAALDCDADAILLTVDPVGPACHTGARSCFDVGASTAAGMPVSAPATQGFDWLEELWATIEQRAHDRPEGSYTAKLLDGGVDAVARKVAEEAIEVVMAAKDDAAAEGSRAAAGSAGGRDQSALSGELADLLYHSLVLMAERGLPPSAVIRQLQDRHSPTP
jgi:phosphoribosyl-ATP pyrophosphohydrolase/phosphoribosyl-AMP cyclohydrolase